jgi:plastocyanin
MPNYTGNNRPQTGSWGGSIDGFRSILTPFATPAVAFTAYCGTAYMRDANGNIITCDDTQRGEFIGVLYEVTRPLIDTTVQVYTNGVSGDSVPTLEQPSTIEVYIANANPGDEGRKVYWLFNNQVQYTPGNNGNYAGTIWRVIGPSNSVNLATVVIQTPWFQRSIGDGGNRSIMNVPPTVATYQLTKWDVVRRFRITGTIAQTIFLPSLATVSSGDTIGFVYDSASANATIISGFGGTDTINGVTTATMGTSRYSRATFEADTATPQWLQVG